jgi:hypothetical protein
MNIRPSFGVWLRGLLNNEYWMFWYNGRLCDSYSQNWSVLELTRLIRAEHRTEEWLTPTVWEGRTILSGDFDRMNKSLIVTEMLAPTEDCPKFWDCTIQLMLTNETAHISVSRIHPIGGASRSGRIHWMIDMALEVRFAGVPILEVECQDRLAVQIYDSSHVTDTETMRVLVHCEGQELEMRVCNRILQGRD